MVMFVVQPAPRLNNSIATHGGCPSQTRPRTIARTHAVVFCCCLHQLREIVNIIPFRRIRYEIGIQTTKSPLRTGLLYSAAITRVHCTIQCCRWLRSRLCTLFVFVFALNEGSYRLRILYLVWRAFKCDLCIGHEGQRLDSQVRLSV